MRARSCSRRLNDFEQIFSDFEQNSSSKLWKDPSNRCCQYSALGSLRLCVADRYLCLLVTGVCVFDAVSLCCSNRCCQYSSWLSLYLCVLPCSVLPILCLALTLSLCAALLSVCCRSLLRQIAAAVLKSCALIRQQVVVGRLHQRRGFRTGFRSCVSGSICRLRVLPATSNASGSTSFGKLSKSLLPTGSESLSYCLCLSYCLMLTHSHTFTITCTCCYDQIKGTQDEDFSYSFSDSVSYCLTGYHKR